MHLVKRRTAVKNRVHSILIAFGYPRLASDFFGVSGLPNSRTRVPRPWHSNLVGALRLIDELDPDITGCERDLRRLGADHRYVELLVTAPGIGWVLGYTIAAEIGDIERFASAKKPPATPGSPRSTSPASPTGAAARQERPAVSALGAHRSRRARRANPCYRHHYERTKRRCGKQRGAKIARVEIARKLATAIWHMLTRGEPFAPTGPDYSLTA